MKKIIFFFKTLSKEQLFHTTLLFLIIYYCFGLVFSIIYVWLYLVNSYLKNRKINFRKGMYLQR